MEISDARKSQIKFYSDLTDTQAAILNYKMWGSVDTQVLQWEVERAEEYKSVEPVQFVSSTLKEYMAACAARGKLQIDHNFIGRLMAQDLMARCGWVVIDTETTGFTSQDAVWEIAVIDQWEETTYHNTFNPGQEMSDSAFKTHGVTSESLRGRPRFDEEYKPIYEALHGKMWVAYNIDFDQRMIAQDFNRRAVHPSPEPSNMIDAMHIFSRYANIRLSRDSKHKGLKNHKLTAACEAMGIEVEEAAHGAVGDCKRVVRLIEAMSIGDPIDISKLDSEAS